MATLNTKARKTLPTGKFGLPGPRKYPIPDRAHAGNAKARAAQQEKKGNLSAGQNAEIDAKANAVLAKK